MTAEPAPRTTFDEWLAFEEGTQDRHELVDGSVVNVQGGTDRHDTIVLAIYDRLVGPFREQRCRVFVHNRKVAAANGDGYYPDVVVRCGPRTDDRYEASPAWAFEVLSESNRPGRMLRKFAGYTGLPGLQGYVIVDSDGDDVQAHVRSGDVWHTLDITGRTLPVGPVLLDFAELFEAVERDLALGE